MKSNPGILAPLMALTLALTACGGDQQLASGGVGEGGTGIVIGTTTGFGSVIVDGAPWDDRDARIEVEADPSAPAELADIKLGQRVEIEFAPPDIARRIRIEPEAIGPIASIGPAADEFTVAGQRVRVNADPLAGPVTLFDGVADLAGLAVADIVEIHGTPRFDAVAGRGVVVASRIERRAALPAGLIRVSGEVQEYDPATGRFRLGELTVAAGTALITPANRGLANGQSVVVWGEALPAAGPTLNARFIRIRERATSGREAQIAGPVSRYDAANARFEIGGVRVDARAAMIEPASQTLADGKYVVAGGRFGSDGVLLASRVKIRRPGAGDIEIELRGTVTDFVSAADFRVRGVRVDASAARLTACPAAALAADRYVQIEGSLQAGRVVASQVHCRPEPGTGAVVERSGRADNVDAAARTFTLTPVSGAALAVAWTDTTLFVAPLTPQTLAASTVKVTGYFGAGGAFTARRIQLRD
ncbi:MAG: DUF5666 domain-containing protein [Pseudomonadota bacterium]